MWELFGEVVRQGQGREKVGLNRICTAVFNEPILSFTAVVDGLYSGINRQYCAYGLTIQVKIAFLSKSKLNICNAIDTAPLLPSHPPKRIYYPTRPKKTHQITRSSHIYQAYSSCRFKSLTCPSSVTNMMKFRTPPPPSSSDPSALAAPQKTRFPLMARITSVDIPFPNPCALNNLPKSSKSSLLLSVAISVSVTSNFFRFAHFVLSLVPVGGVEEQFCATFCGTLIFAPRSISGKKDALGLYGPKKVIQIRHPTPHAFNTIARMPKAQTVQGSTSAR